MNNQINSTAQSLQPLLKPNSIAVIGASDDPNRIGGRPIRYLLNAGFAGAIYPVNPNREIVQGLTCYSSIGAIGQPVDCAVIIVPAATAVSTVRDCAAAGVKTAIVFSAGFAEVGEEGRLLQEELTNIARETGLRILGPNTNGAVNNVTGAYQTFSMATEKPDKPGRVGLVSQSGGYGSYILHLTRKQGLNLAQWCATGNECDVEIGEVMLSYAEDPDIDVIMAYAEGLRAPATFIRALEAAQRNNKPVVMLKVGRSDAGAKAAASHTAALAGSDEIYEAVFREFGVYRANTPEELISVAYAASAGKLPRSRKVVVMTASGGVGVHTADHLRAGEMELPDLGAETQKKLLELSPMGSAGNPVDTTAQVVNDATLLSRMMTEVLDREDIDSILTLLAHSATSPDLAARLVDAIKDVPALFPDKILSIALASSDEVLAALREAGFLVFEDTRHASMALSALSGFRESFDRPTATRPMVAAPTLLPAEVNEREAKRLLADCGIPAPKVSTATTPEAAAEQAVKLGFPVVIKILSADIVHKTEVGGVAVGLKSAEAVSAAAEKMLTSVATAKPDARIDGFLIEQMVVGGTECIVGVTQDPAFGPVIMFGLGGVSVEVFGDVTFRLAPVTLAEAGRMIHEIKGLPLLMGHRGAPKADIDALARAIVALSEFGAANAERVTSIEINPLLVLPEGQGVVALDAAIEMADTQTL